MDKNQNHQSQEESEVPKFRGLYRHVHISVKTLDYIIIGCIAVIILFTFIGLRNPGCTVTFDSNGGTDVAAQNQEYDSKLELPQDPTREGYVFTGWYVDAACDQEWDEENGRVKEDMLLYAGWEKKKE